MATIKRTTATSEAIESAKKSAFTAGYGFNQGQLLTIKEFGFISHSVDGVDKRTACPVTFLENTDEVIYIRSLIKERFDYQGKAVEITGTFNLKVREFLGKTWGEALDYLNANYVGKHLKAIRKTYMGINKNGDVQPISFNEFDFAD